MKTRITELFGIKHPIMLAGASWLTEPKLVSAVSNAGGLGILAIGPLNPEEVRKAIREIKERTDKPFGIEQSLIHPRAAENLEVAFEEKVPIINYALGRPWFIERVHEYGGKVIGTVALVRHAIRAQELGVDALSVTGFEAAAHGAEPTSMVLIPLVASAVKIPFVAAGGFFDGRGLAAALALGADAISMGTRFGVTKECILHENVKQAFIKATDLDTIYSERFDGMGGRALKSRGAEAIARGKGSLLIKRLSGVFHVKKMLGLSWWDIIRYGLTKRTYDIGSEGTITIWQQLIGSFSFAGAIIGQKKAIYDGDLDLGFTFAGQSMGGIHDIPSVQELVERMVAEAEGILGGAREKYAIS